MKAVSFVIQKKPNLGDKVMVRRWAIIYTIYESLTHCLGQKLHCFFLSVAMAIKFLPKQYENIIGIIY